MRACTNIKPSLLTIQSRGPLQDATFLQKLFPRKFEAVYLAESSIVLNDMEGKITFVIIGTSTNAETSMKTDQTPCQIVTWLAEEDEIEEAFLCEKDSIDRLKFGNFLVNKICLPSQSSVIFMLPPRLLQFPREFLVFASLITETSITDQQHQNSNDQQGAQRERKSEEKVLYQQPALPRFPTLQTKLLDKNNHFTSFPLNSQRPIDIETDLFKGKTIVLVRPSNPEVDDSYWNEKVFSKKKRRFIIQIQGKFLREPSGTLFAGSEVSEQMKLGLVTRGLCAVLLRIVETFNNNIHYSFGDNQNKEKPHIVAPAYNFFDCIIATQPGENPPNIEEMFEESAESALRRKKSTSTGQWNTNDTYSFSFYSMYIDLPNWQLVGVPGLGDLSLKAFWGNSLLNICMYEKTNQSKQHFRESNNYAFSLQMEFLGKHHRLRNQESSSSESNESDENSEIIHWSKQGSCNRIISTESRDHVMEQHLGKSPSTQLSPDRSVSSINYEDDENDLIFFDAKQESDNDSGRNHPVGSLSRPVCFCVELLAKIDDVCPAYLEVCSIRGGSYSKVFVANFNNCTYIITEKVCEDLVRLASNYVDNLIRTTFSPRMSSTEILRRSLGIILSSETSQSGVSHHRIQVAIGHQKRFNDLFRKRQQPVLAGSLVEEPLLTCFIARAVSDRHWVEELAILSSTWISFLNPSSLKLNFRVPISGLMKVDKLDTDLCPRFPGFYFVTLQTPGRSHYLMFPAENDQNSWIRMIISLKRKTSNDVNNSPMKEIDNPADEFIHKSTMWNCKNRRTLNCGKFVFRQLTRVPSLCDPLALVETALRKGLEPREGMFDDFEQRREFLNCTAALKHASVYGLSEDASLAFFLNLYHVMITHAYLVLGPPDSSLKWISYFNNISYEVGDDIFSLAELEHCIIRAKMSYPSHFISRFVLPKSWYQMAIQKADFRINFALNCGSLSNPANIILYQPNILEQQLDQASKLYLEGVPWKQKITKKVELRLPKVCQWFLEDFGSSSENLLKRLHTLLPDDARRALACHWMPLEQRYDMSCCLIRYQSFNFECRPLSLLQ